MSKTFIDAIRPLLERTSQLLWLEKHWYDIEADALVFYGIDDIENYPDSAKFFRLAYRLPAYRGVMRERAMAQQMDKEGNPRPRPTTVNSKIKSTASKKGYERINNVGEQKAMLRSSGEVKTVKKTGKDYLKNRLKQAK